MEGRNLLFDKNIDKEDEEDIVVQNINKKFENDEKKTFKTIGKEDTSIKKKIEGLKQLSTNSDKCLIGWPLC